MAFLNFNGLKQYNKKIKQYINDKIKDIEVEKLATKDELALKADKSELFSGDYNDLANKPVIPDTTNLASKSDLTTHTDNNAIHVTSAEKNAWNNKLDNTDLTQYAKKADLNASLDTKVDKVSGKSLVSDTEIARLATINNYDDTNIKNAISKKADKTELFSGSYNDLTDKPNIPNVSNFASKSDLTTHTDNNTIHVTSSEKTKWNAKLDNADLTNYATKTFVTDEIAKASTGSTVDLTGYAKTADVNASLSNKVDKVTGKSLISDTEIARLKNVNNYDDTDIKRSINAKASKSDVDTHTSDASIHVTSAEKIKWNNKADASDIPSLTNYATKTFVTDEIAKAATSGKVDLTGYAKTVDVNASLNTKVDKVAGKSLISDTEIARLKLVDNYDDTDIKRSINAKASNADLTTHTSDNNIHITSSERAKWNAKADVSDIPSLTAYATKTFVSDEIAKAVTSGTVDLSGYAKKIELTNHTNDADIHVTSSDKNNWNNKANDFITHKSDTDIHVTANDKQKWNSKANGSDFTTHKNDADIHVTADDKDKWNAKLDNASLADYAKTVDVNSSLNTKVDKVDGKGLSTNDYTTDEKTKVGKIITSGNGTSFLANDGTYKKVSSSTASAVAERKFKPVFGFDTYWGEMRDNHGNKNQVELARIKQQIDQCEAMKVDRIICTIHLGWDETTNSLVIAENTDSISTAISYCNGKNVTIDTAKVHVHFKGTTASEKDYINNTIGMSTFQTKYKAMLNTICNLFKGTTVTRIIILNEMWYITNANLGYSSFVNECLSIVKSAGYATGLSMAGFNTNLQLSNEVIKNLDTFYINVYPGISGFGKYITKQEAIEAFEQCDVDLWIEKIKKQYPDKKIVISEMGTDDYWENLAAPSTWYINGTSKTGGHAVDTYITAMMEFFTNKNVDIEELWWWYNLYYEPVKETLLNYLGGDR